MATIQDTNKLDEELCNIASSFTKSFYGAMDIKREKINLLYCDDRPSFVWNGHACEGQDAICQFTTALPETQHVLQSVDVQKIPDAHSGMENCLIVVCAGSVTVGGEVHAFSQTFTLAEEDGKHKVKSNRMRYVD